jgi:hypothetical protein
MTFCELETKKQVRHSPWDVLGESLVSLIPIVSFAIHGHYAGEEEQCHLSGETTPE